MNLLGKLIHFLPTTEAIASAKTNMDIQNHGLEKVTPALSMTCFGIYPRRKLTCPPEKYWLGPTILSFWNGPLFRGHSWIFGGVFSQPFWKNNNVKKNVSPIKNFRIFQLANVSLLQRGVHPPKTNGWNPKNCWCGWMFLLFPFGCIFSGSSRYPPWN